MGKKIQRVQRQEAVREQDADMTRCESEEGGPRSEHSVDCRGGSALEGQEPGRIVRVRMLALEDTCLAPSTALPFGSSVPLGK